MKKKKADIINKRGKKQKKSFVFLIFKWFFSLVFFLTLSGIFFVATLYYYLTIDLPKISSLKDYRPPIVTSVFSDDDRKIGEFYEQRRIVVPLSDMPQNLINAFIAAEDSRFREHKGIDILSIFRAFVKNFKAGTIVQGGSTITQQITKSFLLSPERTYKRKLKEAILAYRIEKKLNKNEILFLYLNQIYLGHGAYGVKAAAENYFGTEKIQELNLAQCSMLAGLPQAPSRYSPFRFPKLAKQRQIYVLNRMKEDGLITNLEATEAIDFELDIKPRKNWFIERVPWYTEHVRRYVEKKYGKDTLYKEGLKIYTAVNIELQKIGKTAVINGINALDKRMGYRGPLNNIADDEEILDFCFRTAQKLNGKDLEEDKLYKAVVINTDYKKKITNVKIGDFEGFIKMQTMTWARKPNLTKAYYEDKVNKPSQVLKRGDIILVRKIKDIAIKEDQSLDGNFENNDKKKIFEFVLEQEPNTQSALLCLESETGHVKAMIGGGDYHNTQFNRAYQSRRQPGSAFKPIIYAAAIDKEYTTASIIIDSPMVHKDILKPTDGEEKEFTWKPKNYKEEFFGPTLFREALVKSRNVVTIKILKDIGIDYVIDYAKKLGIKSDISRNLSIALGSSGVSLLEIVQAYSVFPNLGYLIEPVFITKIYDRDNNLLESSKLVRTKAIDMTTAYIITNMLESVVKDGTGWRIKALKRPVAGKTGTTNELNDAWFIGYTPKYTTGVWAGFDQFTKKLGKGETGSRTASPIWLEFMQKALEGKEKKTFIVPDGISFAKIDAKTGLLPTEESTKTIFECFKEGTIPTKYSPRSDIAIEPEDLFKKGI